MVSAVAVAVAATAEPRQPLQKRRKPTSNSFPCGLPCPRQVAVQLSVPSLHSSLPRGRRSLAIVNPRMTSPTGGRVGGGGAQADAHPSLPQSLPQSSNSWSPSLFSFPCAARRLRTQRPRMRSLQSTVATVLSSARRTVFRPDPALLYSGHDAAWVGALNFDRPLCPR